MSETALNQEGLSEEKKVEFVMLLLERFRTGRDQYNSKLWQDRIRRSLFAGSNVDVVYKGMSAPRNIYTWTPEFKPDGSYTMVKRYPREQYFVPEEMDFFVGLLRRDEKTFEILRRLDCQFTDEIEAERERYKIFDIRPDLYDFKWFKLECGPTVLRGIERGKEINGAWGWRTWIAHYRPVGERALKEMEEREALQVSMGGSAIVSWNTFALQKPVLENLVNSPEGRKHFKFETVQVYVDRYIKDDSGLFENIPVIGETLQFIFEAPVIVADGLLWEFMNPGSIAFAAIVTGGASQVVLEIYNKFHDPYMDAVVEKDFSGAKEIIKEEFDEWAEEKMGEIKADIEAYGKDIVGNIDLDIPKIDFPDIDMPDVDLPVIPVGDFPDIKLPDVDLPDIKLPDMDLPDLKLPDIDLPDIDLNIDMDSEIPEIPFIVSPDTDETGETEKKLHVIEPQEPETEKKTASGGFPLFVIGGLALGLLALQEE